MNELMPEGWYKIKAAGDYEYRVGANSGVPYVLAKMAVLEGEYEGRIVYWTGSTAHGKALEITLESMRTLGWNGDPNSCEFPNEVYGQVVIDQYNGVSKNKVNRISSVAAKNAATQKSTGVSAIQQKLAAIFAAKNGNTQPQKSQPDKNEHVSRDDGEEECPF